MSIVSLLFCCPLVFSLTCHVCILIVCFVLSPLFGTSFAYAILQCTDENLFEEEEDMAWVEDTYVAVWKSKFISYDCENVPILRFIHFQVYTMIDGIQEVT